ncbi:MAG: hypothetical protein R3F37_16180 [Candidatus Competibacteraceae bacterium]
MKTDKHGNKCDKRLPVAIYSLALPKFDYDKAITFAEKLYGSNGIYFDIRQEQCLNVSAAQQVKLEVIDGACKWDQNNSEQDDLYNLVDTWVSNSIVIFIVGVSRPARPVRLPAVPGTRLQNRLSSCQLQVLCTRWPTSWGMFCLPPVTHRFMRQAPATSWSAALIASLRAVRPPLMHRRSRRLRKASTFRHADHDTNETRSAKWPAASMDRAADCYHTRYSTFFLARFFYCSCGDYNG